MPDELTIPTGTGELANGHATGAEPAFLVRARRILSGDIRSEDYLILPAEADAAVRHELEVAQDMHPAVPMAESVRRKVTQDRTLQFHFGRHVVTVLRSEMGVIVVANGIDEIGVLCRAVSG
jgi:hypothetical protein